MTTDENHCFIEGCKNTVKSSYEDVYACEEREGELYTRYIKPGEFYRKLIHPQHDKPKTV